MGAQVSCVCVIIIILAGLESGTIFYCLTFSILDSMPCFLFSLCVVYLFPYFGVVYYYPELNVAYYFLPSAIAPPVLSSLLGENYCNCYCECFASSWVFRVPRISVELDSSEALRPWDYVIGLG